MDLIVINTSGKDTGKKVSLSDSIFAIEPNDHAIYLDVKQYLANGRQGTHKSKQRGEISGSTRKIKKQKGTGGARAGSIKNPLFKGGGRVFGPEPRDYSFKLNKKVKQLARKSALSYKVKDNQLVVVEDFSFEAPKTKEMINVLTALGANDKKSMLVIAEQDKNVYLSSRNLKGVNVVTALELNTYNTMNANFVVMTEGAVQKLEMVLSQEK
jgi:large subunit ribosomal protein L4